jgi:hypothetical protein
MPRETGHQGLKRMLKIAVAKSTSGDSVAAGKNFSYWQKKLFYANITATCCQWGSSLRFRQRFGLPCGFPISQTTGNEKNERISVSLQPEGI